MTIWFDMDGTIADLYGVRGWLTDLEREKTRPYEIARPLVNTVELISLLVNLQTKDIKIGIISWTACNGSYLYNSEVEKSKKQWLLRNFPNFSFDKIIIVPYGTNKSQFAANGDILFDDEERNRNIWGRNSYDETNIFRVLRTF